MITIQEFNSNLYLSLSLIPAEIKIYLPIATILYLSISSTDSRTYLNKSFLVGLILRFYGKRGSLQRRPDILLLDEEHNNTLCRQTKKRRGEEKDLVE